MIDKPRCSATVFIIGLRDADTSGEQAIGTFGLIRDDYKLKDSFDIYRGHDDLTPPASTC